MQTTNEDIPNVNPYASPLASIESPRMSETGPGPEVWSPKAIAVLTFFLSFPATVALVAINRRRLGATRFPTALVLTAAVLATATIILSILVPDTRIKGFNLIINLAMLFYFRYSTIADVDEFRRQYPACAVRRRGWGSGFLIALLGLAAYIVVGTGLEVAAAAMGYGAAE